MDTRWIIRLIITDPTTGRHEVFRSVVSAGSLGAAYRETIAEAKACLGEDINITDQTAEAC